MWKRQRKEHQAIDRRPMPWETLNQPAPPGIPDLGPPVLEALFGKLMIDDKWSVRALRSFTWWPYRLAQRVSVSSPRLAFGDPMVAVRVVNDLVRDVKADDTVVENIVGLMNMHASDGAYVWDPDARHVTVTTSAYIHNGNRSLERFFSGAVLLTTIEAHAKAKQLAELLDGEPATSEHPVSGPRPVLDDLLNFADTDVVPRGQGVSAFAGQAMEAARQAPSLQSTMVTSSPTGLTAELPFFGDMPAIAKAALGSSGPVETSLVELLTEPRHPGYGSGLLALLRLPVRQPPDEIRRLAHGLNRAEANELTGFPQFGAWCRDASDETSLVFATFVPSVLFDPGIITTLLFYTGLRNEWARDRLIAR
jgi:hypothetical protein